jgi:excisionase family DNA binding protein
MADLYTPATLAKHWHCSERHIRNLMYSGQLPYFRLGGKLMRIRGEDVENFQCRQNGASLDLEASSLSPSKEMESATVTRLPPTTRAKLTSLRQPSMQK